MLVANVGSIVSEFAGCGAALGLFGVPTWISALLAATVVVLLLTRGLVPPRPVSVRGGGIGVSLAYFISAVLAHPDWGHAARSLVIPDLASSPAYW